MAKYKVLEVFRNKETQEVYEVGEEVEFPVKRAKEIEENLKSYNKNFLERLEVKEDKKGEWFILSLFFSREGFMWLMYHMSFILTHITAAN